MSNAQRIILDTLGKLHAHGSWAIRLLPKVRPPLRGAGAGAHRHSRRRQPGRPDAAREVRRLRWPEDRDPHHGAIKGRLATRRLYVRPINLALVLGKAAIDELVPRAMVVSAC